MINYLDFEKPIEELEMKIEELRGMMDAGDAEVEAEVRKLEKKAMEMRNEIFSNLTPWQKTQLSRHPDRPYSLNYIGMIATDFIELHGDRKYLDDPALIGGLGKIEDMTAMFIGHQKGRGVKERIKRNFGQPHPEGYRKALRLMKLAERFNIPVVTLIDTPGAYPGIGAEERGQAEAIATNLMEMASLEVPIVTVVIGEGGSGGAIALGVSDRIFMLEHSIYSVISPEGCAAILWSKNGDQSATDFSRAAEALKLTAQDLQKFKLIDDIILEPPGGAHRDPEAMAKKISDTLTAVLKELVPKPPAELVEERYQKLKSIGGFSA